MIVKVDLYCPVCLKDDMLEVAEDGKVFCSRCEKEVEGVEVLFAWRRWKNEDFSTKMGWHESWTNKWNQKSDEEGLEPSEKEKVQGDIMVRLTKSKIAYLFVVIIVATITCFGLFRIIQLQNETHITICDYMVENVSNGAVSLKFLLDKANDFKETTEFCRKMGFNTGTQSDLSIFCEDGKRYKYFSIMKEFAEFIYE